MIRLSQYDDAESQQAVDELSLRLETKKKGVQAGSTNRQFEIEGINNSKMDEHTTEGGPNLAEQFRLQEKNLKSK